MPVRTIRQATTSGKEFGWSISSLPAARALDALKVNPSDHHLIIVYYYKKSSVYELDIAMSKEKHVSERIYHNKIHLECEGGCLAEFLKENLKKISKGREGKLCLKVAELCGGKIRSFHPITNPYNCESFISELEVGTLKDWADNCQRPYWEGRTILKEDFDDGMMVRLCEGEMGKSVYKGPCLSFTDFV